MGMDWNEIGAQLKESRRLLQKAIKKLRKTNRRLQISLANSTISSFERNPSQKEEFIEKLCNPEYVPTTIDELVCKKLSGFKIDEQGETGT